MGSAQTGHSLEWQQAYVTAAPQDAAQQVLVSQLALPMGASQTPQQAKRVDALRGVIAGLDVGTAKRLYGRLSNSHDPLGHLFTLTLHRVTRNSLLGLLDAKRHSLDRGTAPVNRATDQRTTAPTTPIPPPIPPPSHAKPRKWVLPPERRKWSPWDLDKVGPTVPLFDPVPPGVRIVKGPEFGEDDGIRDLVRMAAAGLGLPLSVGLSMLRPTTISKAVEAAWIVMQTYEGTEIKMMMGLAGEAAAETVLADLFGVDQSAIVNLNDLVSNFPLIDHSMSAGLVQTKALGAASSVTGALLAERNLGELAGFLADVIVGTEGPKSKLTKAAVGLLNLRDKLTPLGAWPRDLRATSTEGVVKYIRENLMFAIPDNVAFKERPILGANLYRRLNNPQALAKLGLKQSQLTGFINRQVDRILPLGVSANDLQSFAEVARRYLPSDVDARWHARHDALIRERKARLGRK